jgi:predicted enzyme related to lactoylglutathione lyase
MIDGFASFVWYELLTTNLAAAQSFYCKVVGWDVQDASTPQFGYRIFSVRGTAVAGLMELPLEGRKKGAMPRWVGYVAVQDVDRAVDWLKELGGTVYVPPTESNIGRIAVVADPQTATLALVGGLRYGAAAAEAHRLGHVGWHELLAADESTAFAFYRALFGWEKAEAEAAPLESYTLFAAGGRTLGGMFTKFTATPVPFWLYYFDVADLDIALKQVRTEGGQLAQGPIELWESTWVARCIDPQGAMFALQGKRNEAAIEAGRGEPSTALGWSAAWGGISSRGRLVVRKPKD